MWELNPYYNPEALGLRVVAELEFSDACYQFDTRVVWQHKDGAFYTVRDSGCSCPTPFEDYGSLESLDRLDVNELESEIERVRRGDSWGGNPDFEREARAFLETVRAAL